MGKFFWLIITCLMVVSCATSSVDDGKFSCPRVTIPLDKAYVIQKADYQNEFQIRLTGYEKYCYFDEVSSRHYAMIKPFFSIKRIRATDESRVDFDFYTETIKGPPGYIGKKSYSTFVNIAINEYEKKFSGPSVKVKVPANDSEFEIFLGLDLSASEYEYNKQGFNIDYHYEGDEAFEFVPTVYVETNLEEVSPNQYDTKEQVIVPAPKKEKGCGCSL